MSDEQAISMRGCEKCQDEVAAAEAEVERLRGRVLRMESTGAVEIVAGPLRAARDAARKEQDRLYCETVSLTAERDAAEAKAAELKRINEFDIGVANVEMREMMERAQSERDAAVKALREARADLAHSASVPSGALGRIDAALSRVEGDKDGWTPGNNKATEVLLDTDGEPEAVRPALVKRGRKTK